MTMRLRFLECECPKCHGVVNVPTRCSAEKRLRGQIEDLLWENGRLAGELATEKARRMIDPGAFDSVVMKLAEAERTLREIRRALAGGRQG